MSDEPPRYLESLTVAKLRAVAKHHVVDVSACRHKKDLVGALLARGVTEAQVAEALADGASPGGGAPGDRRTADDVKADIQAIADRPSQARVLPAEADKDVERNIDLALLVRPSFFEIDSQTELAWDHMIMADYHDALKVNAEARSRMLDRFSSFQVFSCALSIRAAESILANLEDARNDADPALRTALAEAKRAFIDGSPRHREETLGELERLASKAFEAFFEGSTRAEAELREMLSEYESFGAQTSEPRMLLEVAGQARQAFNVGEYAKILEEAKGAALRAKETRRKDIQDAFGLVRSAVSEAREVGAVLSVGEKDLEEARAAFDSEAFKRAVDLLASIERAADLAHIERIKDGSVRERQVSRVNETIAALERTIQEAASYGMDVDEGLLFVSRARTALASRDVVNAAKITRHLKDRSEPVTNELYRKRVELGLAKKVEGVRCGKCGKEELYAHPDGARRCEDCGHQFTFAPEPRPATMDAIEPPVSGSGPRKERRVKGDGRSDDEA